MIDDPALALTDEDVRAVMSMTDAVDAVRAAYLDLGSGAAESAERVVVRVPGGWMRLLPGSWAGRGVLGYKEFHLVGREVRYSTYVLDAQTGRTDCVLDANYLTGLRTGATAAVAAEILAPEGPLRVGVIGSGKEARAQLEALAVVRKIASVRVFSPRPERRAAFAEAMSTLVGVDVEPVPAEQAATADADVVLIATSSAQPILRADRLPPGAHLSSIGSTLPEQRELHGDVWASADRIVVDTRQLLVESGDALAAAASGDLHPARVTDLGTLLADPGSPRGSETTMFKSLGAGLQDLAVATVAWEKATAAGLGRRQATSVAARRLG